MARKEGSMNKEMIEQLRKYLELKNEFRLKTPVEQEFINNFEKMISGSEELSSLVQALDGKSILEQEKIISNFESKYSTGVELVSNTYGIDISEIEHVKLDNKKEMFKFYSPKLNRYVILENKEGKSLPEQLLEKQKQDQRYQTEDKKENTESLLSDMKSNSNGEQEFFDIIEIDKHESRKQMLTQEEKEKLQFLIKNALVADIKKINIENVMGLDSEGNIKEVRKNKETQKYEIVSPAKAYYKQAEITNTDIININTGEVLSSSDNLIENYDYEYDFDNMDPVTKEKVEMLYNDESLIERLNEQEKPVWKKMVQSYKKYMIAKMSLNKEQTLQNKPKQLILTKPNNYNSMSGYIDAVVLALFTGFFGGIITAIAVAIIQRY